MLQHFLLEKKRLSHYAVLWGSSLPKHLA
uniref:Uncharacterized protein n=1 Tax=Anguilla anguilla TaxID=7936 RepID=A0A0E9UZ31_ANGAN